MDLYLTASLALAVAGPAVAASVRGLRPVAPHAFLACSCHAAGASLLYLGFEPAVRQAGWGWPVLLPLSSGVYAGALALLLFAARDLRRPDGRTLEGFLRRDPTERVIRRTRRLLWPAVLFPTARGDGSTLFTGRRFRRDVRAAAGWAEVCLTNRRLLAQLLSPKVLIVEIALPDIRAVGFADGDGGAAGLLEVVYADARVGGLTRLAAFTGAPAALPDRLLLGLGGEAAGWLRDLRRALGDQGRPAAAAAAAVAVAGQTPNG
jgi:hypothetical protein